MVWLYRAIFWIPFLATIGIFVTLIYLEFFKKRIKSHQAKEATLAILIIYAAQLIFKILYFYFYTRSSELGQYLLKTPGYLTRNIWYISQGYLGNILMAVIFLLLAIIASKISKRPFFEKSDLWIVFVSAFVAGFPGVFVMVLGAAVLMVVFQLLSMVFKKSQERLSFTPFLLLGTIVVGILNSFSFYINFLQNLKLI